MAVVGGECFYEWKPIRGIELEGGGSGKAQLATRIRDDTLGLQALKHRVPDLDRPNPAFLRTFPQNFNY